MRREFTRGAPAALAVLLALASPARSHDPDTGESNWINDGRYVSPQTGVHCCGPNDCERLDPAKVEPTPGGIILHAYGDEVVPWSEATPSQDKFYWRCHTAIIRGLDGAPVDGMYGKRRCFFAPLGGT
jgi:hypothetical protein